MKDGEEHERALAGRSNDPIMSGARATNRLSQTRSINQGLALLCTRDRSPFPFLDHRSQSQCISGTPSGRRFYLSSAGGSGRHAVRQCRVFGSPHLGRVACRKEPDDERARDGHGTDHARHPLGPARRAGDRPRVDERALVHGIPCAIGRSRSSGGVEERTDYAAPSPRGGRRLSALRIDLGLCV